MCLSRLGQIVYGVLAFATLALIAASMFTPGWRSFSVEVKNTASAINSGSLPTNISSLNVGIFFCQMPANLSAGSSASGSTTSTTNGSSSPTTTTSSSLVNNVLGQSLSYCDVWWNNLQTWEKVVIVVMVLALATALIAFLWNLISFCACCCHGSITKPLPGLAGLTALLLAIALGIYYYYNQSYIQQIRGLQGFNTTDIGKSTTDTAQNLVEFIKSLDKQNDQPARVSYSFYLGCGAAIAAFANMIVGALIVCMSDKCL